VFNALAGNLTEGPVASAARPGAVIAGLAGQERFNVLRFASNAEFTCAVPAMTID